MIEIKKNKILDLPGEKEAALAIPGDRKGKSIRDKDRNITGKMLDPGNGERFYISCTKEVDVPADMMGLLKKNEADAGGITGKSEKMKRIRELVLNYSLEDEPVLLVGETGVGKNHIAELIHCHSGREGKFVVASAPNLQESLFECTLFGHKKGAFTDAKSDRQGLVEEAGEGTLFIDEISGVPLSIQARLLRFIESKKYRVLGESFEREANVRVIAASNKDLVKAIENQEFREDLYYRLNVLEITIPPLRDRKEDIQDFVREKQTYLKGKKIGPGFMEALYNHEWPGNIRELITVLKRAGICCKNPITGNDIINIINRGNCKRSFDETNDKLERIWDELKAGKTFWEAVKKPYLDRELNRCEAKCLIDKALIEAGGKYKDALKIFNIEDNQYNNFMRFLYANRLTHLAGGL